MSHFKWALLADLDAFIESYNNDRTNQGRYCKGRTPMQTFVDGLELYQQYVHESENNLEERRVVQ